MRKIDTHQHFWKYSEEEYRWIGSGMDILKRDYLPQDLKPLIDAQGVTHTIAVQARQTLEETEWLLDLADSNPFIAGIVGWVDLCDSKINEQLERFSQRKKLRGVRHVLHDEPDDCYILGDHFQRGIEHLKRRGLTYDLLIRPPQIEGAIQTCQRFPEQLFIVDHIAKPPIKERKMEPWRTLIQRLAACPNVYCKVSGMVTEADRNVWKPEDLHPYMDVIFECFGTKRIVIGSDWPVCLLAAPYDRVMNAPSEYIQALSNDEQKDIWENNACTFYGI